MNEEQAKFWKIMYYEYWVEKAKKRDLLKEYIKATLKTLKS